MTCESEVAVSIAEQKALLARAYASGETPKLHSVSPDGTNEIWGLGEVLFVLPVVPTDSPPELQYAIRLRRDASLSGKCDECGAAFDIESSEPAGTDSVGTGLFSHRGNCLAADENVAPLMSAFNDSRNKTSLEESLETAIRDTGTKLTAALPNHVKVPATTKSHERFTAFLDEKIASAEKCGHLKSQPAQTWHIFMWGDTWRCDECMARFSYVGKTDGTPFLSPLEEMTCDYCRRYSPTYLQPTITRIGTFVLYGAACRRCAREFKSGDDSMEEDHKEDGA